jgi:RNA polymerase sigma-70 factor, ECF subfamily
MGLRQRRSVGVNETLAVAIPTQAVRTRLDFEALYRSSRDDVFAYVAGMLRDRAAAEDVTAAAFERAYRKRRSFDGRRGEPRAWLFGIARNAALDELRRRRRRREHALEAG